MWDFYSKKLAFHSFMFTFPSFMSIYNFPHISFTGFLLSFCLCILLSLLFALAYRLCSFVTSSDWILLKAVDFCILIVCHAASLNSPVHGCCAPILFIYFLLWPHHAACGILVSWPGIKPMPSAWGMQSLKHLTSRKVPSLILL